ncbi:MAG: acyl-CoA dehydrogenase [Propionibacteriales bacterium]|nr:acyl-CoA dehydrogenase [Propionibacteriales bacterium]
MDLTLTEDQETIQSTARELLDSRSATADARAMAGDPAGYSTRLWEEMVGLGWTGLALPVSYGGVGSGFLELCLLVEELGAHQVPTPFVPTAVCCAMPVLRFGTDEQKKEWLGAVAEGRVMSYVLDGVDGGWEAPGASVVATENGDGFVLDGAAAFVPYADAAGDLLVVARGPGGGDSGGGDSGGLTAFVVDAGTPGIRRTPVDVVGHDPSCHLGFQEVAVASDRVLGGVGEGRAVADAIAAYGAAATCAEMVGGARRVLDMSVEYAGQREQFGRPIGGFQAVQHHCADMAIDVLSARFIAYEAIWRLAEGLDAATEVSMAKAAVGEAYQRVVGLGHQVHGAIGFTKEHALHSYFRHAMASALAFGDGDFHWERVAGRLGVPSGSGR